jgi:hypothetical protein
VFRVIGVECEVEGLGAAAFLPAGATVVADEKVESVVFQP